METVVGRDDALGHLRTGQDLGERFGNAWLAAWSRVQLGILAVVRGPLEEARAQLDEALELSMAGPQHPQRDPVPGRVRPAGVRGG